MSELEAVFRLERRFSVLRDVVASYRIRLQVMQQEVVELFAGNHIEAISECMNEKQRIVLLIQKLEQFIAQWESAQGVSIIHEPKRENLNN